MTSTEIPTTTTQANETYSIICPDGCLTYSKLQLQQSPLIGDTLIQKTFFPSTGLTSSNKIELPWQIKIVNLLIPLIRAGILYRNFPTDTSNNPESAYMKTELISMLIYVAGENKLWQEKINCLENGVMDAFGSIGKDCYVYDDTVKPYDEDAAEKIKNEIFAFVKGKIPNSSDVSIGKEKSLFKHYVCVRVQTSCAESGSDSGSDDDSDSDTDDDSDDVTYSTQYLVSKSDNGYVLTTMDGTPYEPNAKPIKPAPKAKGRSPDATRKSAYQEFISKEIRRQRDMAPGLQNKEYMARAAKAWNKYKTENGI